MPIPPGTWWAGGGTHCAASVPATLKKPNQTAKNPTKNKQHPNPNKETNKSKQKEKKNKEKENIYHLRKIRNAGISKASREKVAVRGARIWARNRYGLAEREEGVKSSKGRGEQSRKWEKTESHRGGGGGGCCAQLFQTPTA